MSSWRYHSLLCLAICGCPYSVIVLYYHFIAGSIIAQTIRCCHPIVGYFTQLQQLRSRLTVPSILLRPINKCYSYIMAACIIIPGQTGQHLMSKYKVKVEVTHTYKAPYVKPIRLNQRRRSLNPSRNW